MITKKTLQLSLKSLRDFAKKRLPDEELIALDERDECPVEIVRQMSDPDKLGTQLLFIPEEYGGMGGSTMDVYLICEQMARIDLGVATSLFATFLGSDPITFGATEEQKKKWLGKIADEGALFAYGATEPDAGSDLGALKTTADRVEKDGKIVGHKINGSKQWISNGGIADYCTILANTPAGPSWFIVDAGTKGFAHDKPEDKHGIRLSNTAALALNDVYVDADRLVGGVEGQGLIQAQLVFGYTRVMVAAFGLGAGWSALDRAIPYSTKRIQGGTPLSEKQGYTHKLIVPNVVKLEAGRAFIEETAQRIDAANEGSLNTEGAIAKYMSTEAGDAAADASIQALGGYGYTQAVEEINFLSPFKFYRDEPRTVTVQAVYHLQGDSLVADCRLIGRRSLPNHPEPQETVHFTARVRLSKQAPVAATGKAPQTSADSFIEAADIYRVYFHGPAYQVLQRAWWDGAHMVGLMAEHLPDNHQPADRQTLMTPRLIELCFQTAGVWEISEQDRFGLPQAAQRVSLLRAPDLAESKLYAVVTPSPDQGIFDAEVVDAKGNCYVRLSGYRTAALPNSVDSEAFKKLHAVMA